LTSVERRPCNVFQAPMFVDDALDSPPCVELVLEIQLSGLRA